MKTVKIKIIFSILLAFLISIAAFLLLQPAFRASAAVGDVEISGIIEIPENDLPDDLETLQQGKSAGGKYIFFSADNLGPGETAASINDGAIYLEKFEITLSFNSEEVSYVLESGKHYMYKLPESFTVTTIKSISDSTTMPVPNCPSIQISDTFNGNIVHEISETDLPDDLRYLEKGEDLSGKYIFFSGDWIKAATYMMNISPKGMLTFAYSGASSLIGIMTYYDDASSNSSVFKVNLDSAVYYYMQLPDLGTVAESNTNLNAFKVSDTFTPADIEDPGTDVEDPGSDIENPDTDAEEPGTVGDWFNDLGNTISDWLGENVGLTVSGSAVLVIGGIILFFIIFRKRR